MKKERLITAELNEDPALVRMNIENIYATVKSGIENVNEMFGTNITVAINPLVVQAEQPEAEQPEPEQSEPEQPEAEQPEAEQPEPEQSEPEQPEAEQPEPEQSEPEQSEPEQSETGQEITINIADDAIANIVITEEIKEGEENANIPNSADETILDGG